MLKKNVLKITLVFTGIMLLAVAIVTLAVSAGRKDDKAKGSGVLISETPTESAWIGEDQSFVEEYVILPEYVKESQIYSAQSTNNLDEFGIFWVEEGNAKAVKSLLMHGYLEKRYNENREWYDSYMPAETPKLRDAEVRVYGDCVAYAVLSPERRTAFFSECEKLLKN